MGDHTTPLVPRSRVGDGLGLTTRTGGADRTDGSVVVGWTGVGSGLLVVVVDTLRCSFFSVGLLLSTQPAVT